MLNLENGENRGMHTCMKRARIAGGNRASTSCRDRSVTCPKASKDVSLLVFGRSVLPQAIGRLINIIKKAVILNRLLKKDVKR